MVLEHVHLHCPKTCCETWSNALSEDVVICIVLRQVIYIVRRHVPLRLLNARLPCIVRVHLHCHLHCPETCSETCSIALSGDFVICVVWIHVHLRCPETFLSAFLCRCMFILHCPETRSFILRRHVHLLCPEMCSSYGPRTWSSAYLEACVCALCGSMFLCIARRYFIRIMQSCPSTLSEGMFISALCVGMCTCIVRKHVHLHCPETCPSEGGIHCPGICSSVRGMHCSRTCSSVCGTHCPGHNHL